MKVSAYTKISSLIKFNPDVIEALAGLSSHFSKLKNPILRKVLASRVSISEAAKIGGVSLNDIFNAIRPLGFETPDAGVKDVKGSFGDLYTEEDITYTYLLDVRTDIARSRDPFNKIMDSVRSLEVSESLLLINAFEPAPLIRILEKQKFGISLKKISGDEFHCYILRTEDTQMINVADPANVKDAFDEVLTKYADNLLKINVRDLPMPQPMIKILETLEQMDPVKALFVYHKKVPVFLIEELKTRNYQYVYKHTDEGLELIIYRP